jgi:hypothetical protein
MSDENSLGQKVREVIQAGTLPNRPPRRMWGGPGVGADCTMCNVSIQRDELELELEFARDNDADTVDKYHVHILCFAAWERERRKFENAGGHPPP